MYQIKEYNIKNEQSVIDLISNIIVKEYDMKWDNEVFINELQKDIQSVKQEEGNFLIAVDEKEDVIGTIAIKKEIDGIVYLKRMYVRKEYRGIGLAQKMLDEVLKIAYNNKYEDIYLGTYEKLQPAIKFYTKNGFETYKQDNGKVYMRLSLI